MAAVRPLCNIFLSGHSVRIGRDAKSKVSSALIPTSSACGMNHLTSEAPSIMPFRIISGEEEMPLPNFMLSQALKC
jgi:hypothetical protein